MNPEDTPDPGEYRCQLCHGLLDGFDCPRCKETDPKKWLTETAAEMSEFERAP